MDSATARRHAEAWSLWWCHTTECGCVLVRQFWISGSLWNTD